MASDRPPPWDGDGWIDFVVGLDATVRRTRTTFDRCAWGAPPCGEPPADADALIDALLGLDVVTRRIADLLDRCAAASPSGSPIAGSPVARAPGDLLR
jgi:hypothetical protein